MIEGVLDFVRREYEYISARASGPEYLVELVPFLETLRMHPVVAGHLEAMAHDADTMIAGYEAVDAARVAELKGFAEGIAPEHLGQKTSGVT